MSTLIGYCREQLICQSQRTTCYKIKCIPLRELKSDYSEVALLHYRCAASVSHCIRWPVFFVSPIKVHSKMVVQPRVLRTRDLLISKSSFQSGKHSNSKAIKSSFQPGKSLTSAQPFKSYKIQHSNWFRHSFSHYTIQHSNWHDIRHRLLRSMSCSVNTRLA